MSNPNIFDAIQYEIMKMDLPSMLNLLNDCMNTLDNLKKTYPEVRENNAFILNNNSLLLKDNLELLQVISETFSINTLKDNLLEGVPLVEDVKVGGNDDDDYTVEEPTSLQLASQTDTQAASKPLNYYPVNVIGTDNPILLLANNAQALSALGPDGISKFLDIASKYAERDLLKAQTETNIKLSEQRFINIIRYSGLVTSVSAPAALCYYLQQVIQGSAIQIVNTTGNIAASTVETAELVSRNIAPTIINGILETGKLVKGYAPDTLINFGRTLQSSWITKYATESVAKQSIVSATTALTTVSQNALILANIILYVTGLIVLLLTFFVIYFLYSADKVGFLTGVPGFVTFTISKDRKRGGRKTRKHKYKHKPKKNHKKTNKKH